RKSLTPQGAGRPMAALFFLQRTARYVPDRRGRHPVFDPHLFENVAIRILVQVAILAALHCDGLAKRAAKAKSVRLTTYGVAAVNKKRWEKHPWECRSKEKPLTSRPLRANPRRNCSSSCTNCAGLEWTKRPSGC